MIPSYILSVPSLQTYVISRLINITWTAKLISMGPSNNTNQRKEKTNIIRASFFSHLHNITKSTKVIKSYASSVWLKKSLNQLNFTLNKYGILNETPFKKAQMTSGRYSCKMQSFIAQYDKMYTQPENYIRVMAFFMMVIPNNSHVMT